MTGFAGRNRQETVVYAEKQEREAGYGNKKTG